MIMENEGKKSGTLSGGFVSVLALSVLFIVLGAALLLFEGFSMLWVCYLMAAALCSGGIISVCAYFIRKEYLDLDKYGFSGGIFSMVLGLCLFVRAQDIANVGMELSGILLLLHSVILLQHAVQVSMMKGSAAGVLLFFTVLEDVAAVLVITGTGGIFVRYPKAYDWVLIACGVLGLLSMLLVKFRRLSLDNEEKRNRERILEDEPIIKQEAAEEEP